MPEDGLLEITIPGSAKRSVLEYLDFLGVHEHSVYPDVDRLSARLNRIYLNKPASNVAEESTRDLPP